MFKNELKPNETGGSFELSTDSPNIETIRRLHWHFLQYDIHLSWTRKKLNLDIFNFEIFKTIYFSRKRPASAMKETSTQLPKDHTSSNQSNELLLHDQTNLYTEHRESEELFMNQFMDIQNEDVTSLIASLEYLNIDHNNLKSYHKQSEKHRWINTKLFATISFKQFIPYKLYGIK